MLFTVVIRSFLHDSREEVEAAEEAGGREEGGGKNRGVA